MRTRLLAAQIALRQGHPRDAAVRALEAAQAAADEAEVLGELIDTLLQVGETAVAQRLLERPVWQQIDAPDTLLRYADLRQRLGQHVQSLGAFDRLIAMRPQDGILHHYRAQQLEFVGRLEEAATEYEACLARAPGYGDAAYRLVRLRRQTQDDDRLRPIETGLRHVQAGSRAHADFEFARYHVLEDLGRTGAAWQALATANGVMHAHAAADAALEQAGMQMLCDHLTADPPRPAGAPCGSPCPIFIVGLPRTGTTVLERMLANHSLVAGAGELMDFSRQLMRVADTASDFGPAFLARLSTLDFAEVGRSYRAQTAWRAGTKPYFIDKQPGNWLLTGLIHAALPGAKILHLVRDPMEACFSIWRARFGNAHAWSYEFGTLAEHYRLYRRLMAGWHAAYPGAVMDVAYADLVRHPAATLRRVLDFCGLPWEAGCEDIEHNTTPVSTLSSPQVREPVHTRAMGLWRRYGDRLEPLRSVIASAT
jgi:tetratricopeptide (TPR) repeat protein